MTLLQRMDRLVYATRLDRIIFVKMQPRVLRWTPLFVIAALVVGYVLMAKTEASLGRSFLVGWAIFYCAFLAAAWLRMFGPRFRATALGPLDERELLVRSRAHALSGTLLAGFATIGCFYFAAAGIFGLWLPHTPNDWVALGLGLQAGGIVLPTLIASWLEPRPPADLEG